MIKRILLRLYPAAWRKEYGEEFAYVLASRPLSIRAIADVAWSAAWLRLRSVPVWLIAGAFLFALELWRLFSPGWLALQPDPKDLILAMTGLWIASRPGSSFRAGVAGTVKVGLVGMMPGVFVTALWTGLTPGIRFFFGLPHGLAVVLLIVYSALLGVCGAYCGRLIARFRGRVA